MAAPVAAHAPAAAPMPTFAQATAPAPPGQGYPSEFGIPTTIDPAAMAQAAPVAPPVMEFAQPQPTAPAAPLQPGQMPDLPTAPEQQWAIDPATGQPLQQQQWAPPQHGEVA